MMNQIAIRRTVDYVNKQVRDTLNSTLTANPEFTKVNFASVRDLVQRQLNNLVCNNVITNFSDVKVATDPLNSYRLNIDVCFTPVMSMKYINTTFTISGEADELTIEEKLVRYLENKPW